MSRRNHHELHSDPLSTYTRRRLLVAGVLGVVPLAAWARWSSTSSAADIDSTGSTSLTTGRTDATLPVPGTTTSTTFGPPKSEIASIDHQLSKGMSEGKVEGLQTRLIELGFDPGPVDGYFGDATLRSVWAFEKLIVGTPRDQASGVVTPDLWDVMHDDVTVTARRDLDGTHLEVYLPEQVAVLFFDGQPRLITHVSSGDGADWCDEVTIDNDDGTETVKGVCGVSVTPGGVFHFERKIEGWRSGSLGRLYQPVYFNYGIAVHGASNVPSKPASHGCVRMPMHIAEYFPDLVSIGDAVYVFDGVEDPEIYGAQLPVFDFPDPDWVPPTTTTTTTTTAPTTTNPVEPPPSAPTTHGHTSTSPSPDTSPTSTATER